MFISVSDPFHIPSPDPHLLSFTMILFFEAEKITQSFLQKSPSSLQKRRNHQVTLPALESWENPTDGSSRVQISSFAALAIPPTMAGWSLGRRSRCEAERNWNLSLEQDSPKISKLYSFFVPDFYRHFVKSQSFSCDNPERYSGTSPPETGSFVPHLAPVTSRGASNSMGSGRVRWIWVTAHGDSIPMSTRGGFGLGLGWGKHSNFHSHWDLKLLAE